MLLLAFVTAWLRPTVVAQSVTSLDAPVKQEVDGQLATKDLTQTDTVQVAQEKVNATGHTSHFNIQAQTACETEMLHEIDAREVFSGMAYEVLTEIAPAYGRQQFRTSISFPEVGIWSISLAARL